MWEELTSSRISNRRAEMEEIKKGLYAKMFNDSTIESSGKDFGEEAEFFERLDCDNSLEHSAERQFVLSTVLLL